MTKIAERLKATQNTTSVELAEKVKRGHTENALKYIWNSSTLYSL